MRLQRFVSTRLSPVIAVTPFNPNVHFGGQHVVSRNSNAGLAAPSANWFRDIGGFDPASHHHAQRVDQQVAFASLHALVAVEPPDASALGGLDRLTVQNDHRRANQAAAAQARACS
jgi:hypothetical protein